MQHTFVFGNSNILLSIFFDVNPITNGSRSLPTPKRILLSSSNSAPTKNESTLQWGVKIETLLLIDTVVVVGE
jgi:hypothetical protein